MTNSAPPTDLPPQRGRLVAVDYGTKRIGLAVADWEIRIATPLETWQRDSQPVEARKFRKLATEEGVTRFIVGLPVHTNGAESGKSREARAFGAWLEKTTGVPVIYFDERYSSSEAEGFLLSTELTKKKRKGLIDSLAAAIFLQAFLESNKPQGTTDAEALDD